MRNSKRTASIRTDRADPLYPEVGRIMAEARYERGLSQRDVGALLDLDNASISLFESGRNRLSLGIFVRWCEVLQVVPGVVLESAREQAEGGPRVPAQATVKGKVS